MKKEEFRKSLKETYFNFFHYVGKNSLGEELQFQIEFEKDTLKSSVIVGGVQGGSCWGSSDPQDFYVHVENPREFFDYLLYELFLKYKKDIPFLVYENFIRNEMQRKNHREKEYYGNRTDYVVYELNFNKLFSMLFE